MKEPKGIDWLKEAPTGDRAIVPIVFTLRDTLCNFTTLTAPNMESIREIRKCIIRNVWVSGTVSITITVSIKLV